MKLTLTIQQGQDEPQIHVFADFPVRIGRDETCELRLVEPFVSRVHARIEERAGQLVLIDEGSRNGLVCDGEKLASRQTAALRDGSELRIKQLVAIVGITEETEGTRTDVGTVNETVNYAANRIDPNVVDRVGVALNECRAARDAAVQVLVQSIASVAEDQRPVLTRQLTMKHPELAEDAAFRGALERLGCPPPAAVHDVDTDVAAIDRALDEGEAARLPTTQPDAETLLDFDFPRAVQAPPVAASVRQPATPLGWAPAPDRAGGPMTLPRTWLARTLDRVLRGVLSLWRAMTGASSGRRLPKG